jgi:hypothetical protein
MKTELYKPIENIGRSLFQVGNIVFPTHKASAETPYCQPHSKPMANAIRLLRAYSRSREGLRFVRKNSEILKVMAEKERNREWQARTPNEHIAKIAALPRGINICVFSQPSLALIMCCNAATSAICHYVKRKFCGKYTTTARKVKKL